MSKLHSVVNKVRNSASAKNGFWIILERFFSVGVVTIITILSARYLGASSYGLLSYGLSFVTLFLGVMKLGLDSILVNELIRTPAKRGEYLGTSLILRLISSVLSMLAIYILLLILNGDQTLLIVVALIQSLILIFQAFNVLDFWFQSQLKSKYVSLAKIAATVVVAIYSAYLLLTGKDVVWFAASTALTSFVVALCLFVFYRFSHGPRLSFSIISAKYLLSKSHHFIVAGIISLVYAQIGKVLIGNMLGDFELGLYAAGLTIVTAWIFFPDALITSLRPAIVNAKQHSESRYILKLKQLYFLLFWSGAGIAFVLTLLAPLLVSILFGSAYSGSIVVVQVAVWFVPLSMLGVARNIWLVAEDKQRYAKYILICGVVVNVGLNIILIPRFGIAGSAIATVATELTTCLIAPLLYRPVRPHTKLLLEAIIYKGMR